MKYLTLLQLQTKEDKFIIDNGHFIAYVGIALTVLYCLFSLYKVIEKSNSNDEKAEALKKEGKTILLGRIVLKNSNSFWNGGESIILGYFYETEDSFVSMDGTNYYKNSIESYKLKST